MKKALIMLFVGGVLAGCSPKLSPLYRDYRVGPEPSAQPLQQGDSAESPESSPSEKAAEKEAAKDEPSEQVSPIDDELFGRIERGLENAGWILTDAITENIVATELRTMREWGLYSIQVELEVAPVGGDYVRLLVHPYRLYFTGAKSKIPYLRGSLARSVLKDLHESFAKEGLTHIGTAQSRDKAALQGG